VIGRSFILWLGLSN